MARLLLLDVLRDDETYVSEYNKLQDFYDDLETDVLDITRLTIGGKTFDVFVDDIGLFRENKVISAISVDPVKGFIKVTPLLVGNLIFANHDAEGNTTDLSDDDIQLIKKHIQQFEDGKALVLRERR